MKYSYHTVRKVVYSSSWSREKKIEALKKIMLIKRYGQK